MAARPDHRLERTALAADESFAAADAAEREERRRRTPQQHVEELAMLQRLVLGDGFSTERLPRVLAVAQRA